MEPELEFGPEALELLPDGIIDVIGCPLETACRTCTPSCTSIIIAP